MRAIFGFLLILLSVDVCSAADNYPNKPVRLIVSFGTGGSSDFTGRLLAEQLSQQLGQQVVVENRPGAGGMIGNQVAASAAPDGYTVLLVDVSFTTTPGLRKTMPYDVVTDFTPISLFSTTPNVVVINPSLDIKSMNGLLKYARENPKSIRFGSSGIGTPGHLSGELLKSAAKLDITHIPYKGGGELMSALLGGHVQMLVPPLPTVLGQIKSGQMVPLMVTTNRKRSPSMPDVPTAKEAGLPDVDVETWFGLVGPRGMPAEIVEKLRAAIAKAVTDPSLQEKLAAQGAEALASSPEEFGTLLKNEVRRWTRVIQEAGIPKID
jgi:tripartite-type tricarboxylate transporter receptor subunit TctC